MLEDEVDLMEVGALEAVPAVMEVNVVRKLWTDYSPKQRGAIRLLGLVELVLAAAAWVDLWRRPRELVVGRKTLWAFVIAVNFVGPLTYFRWGRRIQRCPQRQSQDNRSALGDGER